MRLIDADVLIERISSDKLTEYVYRKHGVQKMIVEAPTVEAVRVEVIQKRIDDLIKMLLDIDDSETDYILHLRIKIETLRELLAMWAWRECDETD